VAIFVATFLLGYIMAIINDKEAAAISKEIWEKLQFVDYTQLDRGPNIGRWTIDYDPEKLFGETLQSLCDWCFTKGIDAQALYLMGAYCKEMHRRYERFPQEPPDVEIAQDVTLPWRSGIGFNLCYLTMRQIAIKLHAPAPPEPMTLNDKIKSLFLSNVDLYIIWTSTEWGEHFGKSRQAVEKTPAWARIRELKEKIKGERDSDRKDHVKAPDYGTRRKAKGSQLNDLSESDEN